MSNQFNNKDGDQNIAQGDGVVGKQVNDHRTASQTIAGNENIAAGRDINITNINHPPTSPESICVLPSEDDVFLHREQELTWLDKHLHPDKVVAICGPGGMGKTALTARVLRRLPPDRFPDGIIFHSFYHQTKTAQAVQTFALALGIKGEADSEQEVATALGSRQALLILDGAEEAKYLREIIALRGQCGVLITTRKKSDCGPLRWDLQPLPDKQAEEVLRAWSGDAGEQEAIKQIAERLGGWPVALRLAGHYLHSTGEPAADYLRWLQEEPFKELGEKEEHQRDNAALLLKRSTAQVGEDARLVLGLAGYLAFDLLATAPMIALLEVDERRCRKAVNELVNYGLLERRGDRLHIGHALIHEYAARHLPLSKEYLEQVAAYYIDWCKEQSAAGVPGYALLDKERVHCLRLIAACLDGGLWQEVKGLVRAIWEYLDRQGHWAEQLVALKMGLTAAQQNGGRYDEHWCLNSLGYTCTRRGEYEKAIAWLEQSQLIALELGDRKGEGTILNNIGSIYWEQGENEQALYYYKLSLPIHREIDDRKGEGRSLNNIAGIYDVKEEYEQALSCYKQCLHIWRELGYTIGEGATLNNIAKIYSEQGKPSKAVEQYKKALAIAQEVGERAGEAVTCWNISFTYRKMGDLAQAEQYITKAVEIAEQIGHPALELFRDGLERVCAKRRGA